MRNMETTPPTVMRAPEHASDDTPERVAKLASDIKHHEMLSEIIPELTGKRHITYVPFKETEETYKGVTMASLENEAVQEALKSTRAIICIGRDSQPNPEYDETQPERNIILTPSAQSNVEMSSGLYHEATWLGNEDVRIIATGKYNNRALDMENAKGIVGEAAGILEDDMIHVSESQLAKLLDGSDIIQAKDRVVERLIEAGDERGAAMARRAFESIMYKQKVAESADLEKMRQAMLCEFEKYPRMAEATLMREVAIEAGVPYSAIVEEADSVDTISNLVHIVANEKAGAEDYQGIYDGPVVVVASRDHAPRTTWIVDHVLPDGVDVVIVESDPQLPDDETLVEAMERELRSSWLGKNWIGGTRDINELQKIVTKGYFSENRLTSEELAKKVQQQSATK